MARQEYFNYYAELFRSGTKLKPPNQYTDLKDEILIPAIHEALKKLGRGKAISSDYFPDDALDSELIRKLVIQDRDIIFRGPTLPSMLKARGILLSKSGSPIANPEETRLIVV